MVLFVVSKSQSEKPLSVESSFDVWCLTSPEARDKFKQDREAVRAIKTRYTRPSMEVGTPHSSSPLTRWIARTDLPRELSVSHWCSMRLMSCFASFLPRTLPRMANGNSDRSSKYLVAASRVSVTTWRFRPRRITTYSRRCPSSVSWTLTTPSLRRLRCVTNELAGLARRGGPVRFAKGIRKTPATSGLGAVARSFPFLRLNSNRKTEPQQRVRHGRAAVFACAAELGTAAQRQTRRFNPSSFDARAAHIEQRTRFVREGRGPLWSPTPLPRSGPARTKRCPSSSGPWDDAAKVASPRRSWRERL